jgi:hypothetical protein
MLERTNFPGEVCEMALGHVIGNAVEAAYRRGDLFEKRRRLMDAWAQFWARDAAAAKVVPLRAWCEPGPHAGLNVSAQRDGQNDSDIGTVFNNRRLLGRHSVVLVGGGKTPGENHLWMGRRRRVSARTTL